MYNTNSISRARIATLVLAPVLALAAPVAAMAATDPGSPTGTGQDYSNTQTTTTRDGVTTTTTSSCMGPDGQVSYQRIITKATEDGKSRTITESGADSCQSDASTAPQNNLAQSPSGRSGPVANPNTIASGGPAAPLVVINNPMSR